MSEEARKRSVGNLQRVYTIVVSLAIVESLRRGFTGWVDDGIPLDHFSISALIGFLVTVVPFYHGANRYLDSTYVTGERKAKSGALMADFSFLFLEGLLFFVISLLINNFRVFYTILACLLVLDAGWVAFTRLISEEIGKKSPSYTSWAIVNLLCFMLILISVWSNLLNWQFWPTGLIQAIAVGAIAVFRTVFDYISVWSFYYPPPAGELYIMPVPRPAPPPNRGHSLE